MKKLNLLVLAAVLSAFLGLVSCGPAVDGPLNVPHSDPVRYAECECANVISSDTCSAREQQLAYSIKITEEVYELISDPDSWVPVVESVQLVLSDGTVVVSEKNPASVPEWMKIAQVDSNTLQVDLSANTTAYARRAVISIEPTGKSLIEKTESNVISCKIQILQSAANTPSR